MSAMMQKILAVIADDDDAIDLGFSQLGTSTGHSPRRRSVTRLADTVDSKSNGNSLPGKGPDALCTQSVWKADLPPLRQGFAAYTKKR
jgi:hypothetical protein